MTIERLNTLHFIAYLKTISIEDLCLNQGITYSAARYRLCRARQAGLVRSEVDRTVTFKPGHGSRGLIWSLTTKGAQRLRYLEQHPEKVAPPASRRRIIDTP